MYSNYDATEFVDSDFQPHKSPFAATDSGPARTLRAPTREEVDSRVAEAHQKLAELKRHQEDLERERSAWEETRRRQIEFQTGRQEMLQHLLRGVGLLEESEFNYRRDAEQMAKTLTGLREALSNVESLHDESWTKDNFNVELTRALTTLENARMEWNSARLKFQVLSTAPREEAEAQPAPVGPLFATHSFGELCRLGFALTWPIAIVLLLGMGAIMAVLWRR